METTSRPNPIPIEQVTIDVSVAYGYPVDPPKPSAATLDDTKDSEKKRACYILIACAVGLTVLLSVMAFIDPKYKIPRFQLDSISVESRGDSTTAVWDISFSIDKPVGDLGVWVRLMGRDYKVESVGTAGNTTVSVTTPWLPPAGGGVEVVEQVVFRCNNYLNYRVEAACKDVVIIVSPAASSTQGVMEGGARLCHVVKHTFV